MLNAEWPDAAVVVDFAPGVWAAFARPAPLEDSGALPWAGSEALPLVDSEELPWAGSEALPWVDSEARRSVDSGQPVQELELSYPDLEAQ